MEEMFGRYSFDSFDDKWGVLNIDVSHDINDVKENHEDNHLFIVLILM